MGNHVNSSFTTTTKKNTYSKLILIALEFQNFNESVSNKSSQLQQNNPPETWAQIFPPELQPHNINRPYTIQICLLISDKRTQLCNSYIYADIIFHSYSTESITYPVPNRPMLSGLWFIRSSVRSGTDKVKLQACKNRQQLLRNTLQDPLRNRCSEFNDDTGQKST